MKEALKICLIAFIYCIMLVLVVWAVQAGRVFYYQKTTAVMVPELTGTELKL